MVGLAMALLAVGVPAATDAAPGLSISPAVAAVAAGGKATFKAGGGTAPYVFSLATNASGGSITPNGAYTAGPTGGVTDVVRVTDAAGGSATAQIAVAAADGAPSTDATRPPNQ